MNDAKQEALRQALHYHQSLFGGAITIDARPSKKPTPEQIVATAAKFEKFLMGGKR
jgi:hypothetical protein